MGDACHGEGALIAKTIVPPGELKHAPEGGTQKSTHHHTAIEYASNNGCSSTGGLWQGDSSGVEGRIAVVVGEVEAGHRG